MSEREGSIKATETGINFRNLLQNKDGQLLAPGAPLVSAPG